MVSMPKEHVLQYISLLGGGHEAKRDGCMEANTCKAHPVYYMHEHGPVYMAIIKA